MSILKDVKGLVRNIDIAKDVNELDRNIGILKEVKGLSRNTQQMRADQILKDATNQYKRIVEKTTKGNALLHPILHRKSRE